MSASNNKPGYALYRYTPSTGASILFCILFLFTTILHFVQMIKTKTWFLTAFVLGGLCEFIGYAARTGSSREEPGHYRLMPFIIQNTYILIAPALFAATIYMTLGRVIRLTDGQTYAVVKPSRITKTFVWGDVLCFCLQGAGGGLIAMDMKNVNAASHKIGKGVIVAGLCLQLLWFVFFVIVAGFFHYRMKLIPTTRAQQPEIRWQKYLHALYVVSGLIMVRSIVRIVEYTQGYSGYIISHEVFLYILDAVLMLIVMVWMSWRHPSEIVLLLRGQPAYTDGYAILAKNRITEQRKWPLEIVRMA